MRMFGASSAKVLDKSTYSPIPSQSMWLGLLTKWRLASRANVPEVKVLKDPGIYHRFLRTKP